MECRVDGVLLHYVEHGDGVPIVALHGMGVDHREIEAALEAVLPATGYRRIYPDLPGMGRSSADGLSSNHDVVALLGRFVDSLDAWPVLLVGHSYGAYLARGLAAARQDLVLGLAVICAVGERTGPVPSHAAIRQDADTSAELDPGHRAGFEDYVVVRTRATAARYRDAVAPGTTLVADAELGRIVSGWAIDLGSEAFPAPTLIVAGRRDSTAGYVDAVRLLDRYPRATLSIIDDAGHALMHEKPELLSALLADWLDRCGEHPCGRSADGDEPR